MLARCAAVLSSVDSNGRLGSGEGKNAVDTCMYCFVYV